MKRIAALFITGLMLTTDLLSQSTPAPGVYEAAESITLLPGFSFTATPGNSLTLTKHQIIYFLLLAQKNYIWTLKFILNKS